MKQMIIHLLCLCLCWICWDLLLSYSEIQIHLNCQVTKMLAEFKFGRKQTAHFYCTCVKTIHLFTLEFSFNCYTSHLFAKTSDFANLKLQKMLPSFHLPFACSQWSQSIGDFLCANSVCYISNLELDMMWNFCNPKLHKGLHNITLANIRICF